MHILAVFQINIYQLDMMHSQAFSWMLSWEYNQVALRNLKGNNLKFNNVVLFLSRKL